MSRPTPRNRRTGWLHTVLTVLVLAAQLVVAIAPLSESRDRRMNSHAESGGQTHRAHNEADCAACQARSIHGSAPHAAVSILVDAAHAETIIVDDVRAVTHESHSPANPRAPPQVI
jgi:hypothetical protein